MNLAVYELYAVTRTERQVMTVEVIKAYLATEIEYCGEYEETKKKAYLKVLKFIENGEEEDRKTNITEEEISKGLLGALKEGE